MNAVTDIMPDYYYYIDPQAEMFKEPQPNPMDNLLDVYQLNDIAKQVARFNEDGTRGVKLRKSYKNQISDIAGHWTSENIPTLQQYGDFQSKIFHYNNSVNPENGQVDVLRRDQAADDKLFQVEDINEYRQVINNFSSQRISNQEFNPSQLAFDFENGKNDGLRRKRTDNNEIGGSIPGSVQSNQQLRPDIDSPSFKRRKLESGVHAESNGILLNK
ncbi:hypothetical protein ACO0SA_002816 [Hanseniaspora valbyensis]